METQQPERTANPPTDQREDIDVFINLKRSNRLYCRVPFGPSAPVVTSSGWPPDLYKIKKIFHKPTPDGNIAAAMCYNHFTSKSKLILYDK
ncbi:hypothetical protein BLOT_012054 [Blomia tropicalis]|nr:hypothetical protein BLOT_012054 [Blomia tropicalis]